jgi:aryl-alcohol dehydrogenase-like predicted oxidoreductase
LTGKSPVSILVQYLEEAGTEDTSMGFERVTLGRTGLSVSPLGIASSYGTNEAMVEEAVDRGVNYLYWGALKTKKMGRGIQRVARSKRDDLVIVAHTTTRRPSGLSKVLEKSLRQLGVDHIDVLLFGGHNKKPDRRLIDHALKLKGEGQVRFLALSGHNRHLFPDLERDKQIDIFHIRYNAAHRGAEREILDHLPEQDGPGVVSFTNTRWGSLIKPANMPEGESPPSAADCYRFVLTHPKVHVAVCGPNSMEQLKEDLEALELGPMSEEELDRMRHIGDHVYKNVNLIKAQLSGIMTIRLRSS